MFKSATLLLLLTSAANAWEPGKLSAYPQKVRTFFSVNDPAVPAALLTNTTPLPVGNVTASARATDGATWLGTTQGLVRLDFTATERDRRHYLAGKRYLPDDDVQQILPDAKAGVWVRTRSGISHIELRPMTLSQKAEWFEGVVHARHDRYGMLGDSRLAVAGDLTSNQHVDNDNNGLWTSLYAAAECFRHRVTKSPAALANARKSLEALLFLEEVAGRRGFPARSYIRKGDRMPTEGEWHWTADGEIYWKGDTSSDEIVGHFFAFSVAYDLLPDGELKKRVIETTRRITDHIITHGYTLVDLDGKPTTWGWWSQSHFAKDPEETALNSLQLLSFLKTAAHITGDARYETEYKKVAHALKYADLSTRVDEFRKEMNYSDEELAMLPLYCLFRYEKDPALLSTYRRAMDAWWKNIQREANPLWTFIYLTGQPKAQVNLPLAVWTLYRMPLDVIHWTVKNSHRADIEWSPVVDRFGKPEALTLLPPDERPVMRWNANPFVIDGGNGGRSEDDGAAFLLPYWLGRYHKFLLGE
jgi:hypothetical protein